MKLYPQIMVHPNIPKPLHGIAPRIIMGQTWWDIERKKAYENAEQRCQACGCHRSEAWPNRWLEAHENYQYQPRGTLVFENLIALCPACHKFIHSGRLEIIRGTSECSETLYHKIINHGIAVLQSNGLLEQWKHRHKWCDASVKWIDFRMVFMGKEYGPSTKSYESWRNGDWRKWKPEATK